MYLVTGGAGFIGSHIVETLVRRGERVRAFDNFSSGRWENLTTVQDDVEVVEGDLRDPDAVRQAADGIEVIFHQGAVPSVPRSIADPRTTFDANVAGTLNLLLAAREAGCRRVVFASSSSVYGNTPVLPKTETMKPNPLSPYAVSKLSGEQLCQVSTRVYNLETVALRYFNVFGPRQDPTSQYAAVIPKFIRALLAGEAPVIYGDGEQSRDFTYIDNIVDANLKAAVAEDVSGCVFNVACGRAVSVNEMFSQVAAFLGGKSRPHYDSPRIGDVRHSLADITAAQEAMGYQATVSFEEGLRRTIANAKAMSPMAR